MEVKCLESPGTSYSTYLLLTQKRTFLSFFRISLITIQGSSLNTPYICNLFFICILPTSL